MQRLLPKSTALLVLDVQERLGPAMEPQSYQRMLRGLDDHMLRDIGITRDQAEHEANKPFWR